MVPLASHWPVSRRDYPIGAAPGRVGLFRGTAPNDSLAETIHPEARASPPGSAVGFISCRCGQSHRDATGVRRIRIACKINLTAVGALSMVTAGIRFRALSSIVASEVNSDND
jgi:hypothetical protein